MNKNVQKNKEKFVIYQINTYATANAHFIKNNAIEIDGIKGLTKTLNHDNGYHFRVHKNTQYIFFGDLDDYKSGIEIFIEKLQSFMKKNYDLCFERDEFKYTQNNNNKNSYHYTIPKWNASTNKLKEIHQNLFNAYEEEFTYLKDKKKNKCVDTTIYSEHWFRCPNQKKGLSIKDNSKHIIISGLMEDFIITHITDESNDINDCNYNNHLKKVRTKIKRNEKCKDKTKINMRDEDEQAEQDQQSEQDEKSEQSEQDEQDEQTERQKKSKKNKQYDEESQNKKNKNQKNEYKCEDKNDIDDNEENYNIYGNDDIKRLLKILSKKRVDDYNDWITAGMAVHNITKGHGLSIWKKWSKLSEKYKKNECETKWKSFKNSQGTEKVTIGTLLYWCKTDNPEEYKEFKIKRKNDQMIIKKYPDMTLELGKTVKFGERICTTLKNDSCVFIEKPHTHMKKPMFVNVHNGLMEIQCRHLDCLGKTCPFPAIKLTKNEMNIMHYGTMNVTINNYSGSDEQLVEFQKYDIFENETVNELVYNSLTGTHSEMADIIYYYFKDKYNIGENNDWYVYENHKWSIIGTNNEIFSAEIEKKLKSLYNELIDYGKRTKMDNEKIKGFKKISKMFGNAQAKRDIMSVVKEKFKVQNNYSRDFVKNLDTNSYLIIFKNGVYDLKEHIFRDGKPSDNMTMTVGYDYKNEHTENYDQLVHFLDDIQPDKKERDFLLTYLSLALYGNILEWFTILTGEGRNGKSKLIELVKKTFGDYYGSVKSQMFTRPQPDANSPDPGLLNLRNKKIVVASEPEKKASLNSGFIKFLTGRDSTQLRQCHKNEMIDFSPKFITLFVCNDIPDTDEIDTAFSKRLRCINFPTEFCKNPKNSKQKLIDEKINEKFDKWRIDFMLLLIEYYKKYMETKEIMVTENILKWTNQYKEETDIYLNFLNDCTEKSNSNIRTSTLYNVFKKWFESNNPKVAAPNNKIFLKNIKKHEKMGKIKENTSVINGIKNLKIIAEFE